jgi:Glycosyltransferase family 87
MDTRKFKLGLILCLSGFVLVNANLLWRVRDLLLEGYGDFASFYTAGKILRQHEGKRLYDPHLAWSMQQEFAPRVEIRRGPLPYIRPPFEALLFLPFAYLSYPAAYAVWTALKICLLLLIAFLLESGIAGRSPSLPGTLFRWLVSLAYFPVAFDLRQGQDAALLLLIFCLALQFLENGSDFRAGIFLGLGLFKFTLTMPLLLVFLVRRKFRFVSGFFSAAAVLLGLSVMVSGWSTVLAYPEYLWTLKATAPGLTTVRLMPNLRGLFAAFGVEGGRTNWVLGGVAILALIRSARIWDFGESHRRLYFRAGFSLAIVVALVTSYYSSSYDLSLLLIPILTLGPRLFEEKRLGSTRVLFLACMGLLLFTPLYWVMLLRFDRSDWIAPILLLFAFCLARMVVTELGTRSGSEILLECPKP